MDRIQRLIGKRQEFSGLKTLLREDLGLVPTHTWNCLENTNMRMKMEPHDENKGERDVENMKMESIS